MMTHPDLNLAAGKERQQRIAADLRALRANPPTHPGKLRRAAGNLLIAAGEALAGRRGAGRPAWTATPATDRPSLNG